MANLGFLGLGIMGHPMARHLMRAGHKVAVWSHTAAKAKELAAAEGGVFCETPAQVGAHAECSFLCVGDTAMSEEVVLGANGVAAGAAAGSVIVDASTVAPSASRAMSARLAAKGIHFLDAPCTGSRPGAEGGRLTFMIGGDKEVFERVKPWFEPMGKLLYYCGGSGMGLNAKLTQNLILSNIMQAFNEGLVLSTKAGINPKLMLEILDNSAAKSGLIAFKAPYVFRRDFSTNFSVRWMHKDIGLMLDSGRELDVPLPLTSLTQQIFRATIARGYGDDDICSTIKVLEEITGVQVKAE
ncbi:MAG: NAD(P)-dependent oxidoreductase [Acidobacteria bacterium]|nr:NAD(P)-dependent oxidoreductase [Acidobacteriota bacterium]